MTEHENDAEFHELLEAASRLPKRIEPPRDLWPGIEARIVARAAKRRWLRWSVPLAAAATLVIAFAIYRLLPPSTAPYRPAEQGWVTAQADYEQAAAELSQTLAAERGRLRPETVTVIERNLRIINAAIAESRAALARDPGNAELRHLFAAAFRQKVELLRWAARVAISS